MSLALDAYNLGYGSTSRDQLRSIYQETLARNRQLQSQQRTQAAQQPMVSQAGGPTDYDLLASTVRSQYPYKPRGEMSDVVVRDGGKGPTTVADTPYMQQLVKMLQDGMGTQNVNPNILRAAAGEGYNFGTFNVPHLVGERKMAQAATGRPQSLGAGVATYDGPQGLRGSAYGIGNKAPTLSKSEYELYRRLQ